MAAVDPLTKADVKAPCLQEPPAEVHGILSTAIKQLFQVVSYCWATEHPRRAEAEKLLHMFPRMIFPRPTPVEGIADDELRRQAQRKNEVGSVNIRIQLWEAGCWEQLTQSAEKGLGSQEEGGGSEGAFAGG